MYRFVTKQIYPCVKHNYIQPREYSHFGESAEPVTANPVFQVGGFSVATWCLQTPVDKSKITYKHYICKPIDCCVLSSPQGSCGPSSQKSCSSLLASHEQALSRFQASSLEQHLELDASMHPHGLALDFGKLSPQESPTNVR